MTMAIDSFSRDDRGISHNQPLSNAWVPLAQWLAILTMTIEHVTKFVWPGSSAVPWAIALGRVAFPLFAGMVAWHLLYNTRRPILYGFRLLVVGILAQLPYALVVTPDKLNVCFTLAAGLLLAALLVRPPQRTAYVMLAWLTLSVLVLSFPHLEYSLCGIFLVPAFVLAFRYSGRTIAAIPLLCLAALINGSPLYMLISTATAMMLVMLANGSLRLSAPVPAIPRPLRLSWYPLHLFAIALLVVGQ